MIGPSTFEMTTWPPVSPHPRERSFFRACDSTPWIHLRCLRSAARSTTVLRVCQTLIKHTTRVFVKHLSDMCQTLNLSIKRVVVHDSSRMPEWWPLAKRLRHSQIIRRQFAQGPRGETSCMRSQPAGAARGESTVTRGQGGTPQCTLGSAVGAHGVANGG